MPLTLGLPYKACLTATHLVRKLKPATIPKICLDQKEYFKAQYQSTDELLGRFAREMPLRGKVVLDVGCGLGGRAAWFIKQGATSVLCIDINRQELKKGRELVDAHFSKEIAERISFFHPTELDEEHRGDVAFLIDSFEHLTEPATVLNSVYGMLRPGGLMWIGSIGWYNYAASHLAMLVPIPWCQVLFSEQAILQTIKTVMHEPGYQPSVWEQIEGVDRWDKVTTLRDRPGEPLNMLSLHQIKQVLRASKFELERFETHGFTSRSKLAYSVGLLARLPLLDEVCHRYYTVRGRRA